MSSGKASALGRTQGNGAVDAAAAISNFMGTSKVAATNAGQTGVGEEDDLSGLGGRQQRRDARKMYVRGLLDGIRGNAKGGAAGGVGGLLGGLGGGGGGTKGNLPAERSVADTMGMGTKNGLPTADDQGMVTMVFRQVRECFFSSSRDSLD